ncbi:MAG: GNAT family N-acetyltransferase [Acidobacteria bacterium]|nr:GNAT family N-acetyltransferase [Acidobacteriota bacterium]
MKLTFKPVTPERWNDFEELFGERGACGGCWCMYWRERSKEFQANKGSGNREAMKRIILDGKEPGIIAYDGKKPIGWCSIAPREEFTYFERTRKFKPLDDRPAWVISCLFLLKDYRGKNLSTELIKAAVEFAAGKGAEIVEGYPNDIPGKTYPPPSVWTGMFSSFIDAGFKEAARPSPTKPIVRFYIR